MKRRRKRKERYLARPDELVITRAGDTAIIAYKDEDVPTTHLTIGPKIRAMTDLEIVALFNDTLRAQAQLASEYKHLAVEVPLGEPQLKYLPDCNQWAPRSNVLRCDILDDERGQLVIGIDDHELTLEEFGRLLVTHAGWGMRIEIVPIDGIHHRPKLEVREPDAE